jgi:hypothetical protein
MTGYSEPSRDDAKAQLHRRNRRMVTESWLPASAWLDVARPLVKLRGFLRGLTIASRIRVILPHASLFSRRRGFRAKEVSMKRLIWTLLLTALAVLPQSAWAGQFKKPVYYSVPGLPWAIVTADFNGDGNLDLAVAEFDGKVQILSGKGDGTFRKGPSFTIPDTYSPVCLAVGDFDGNGTLDLAVVEYIGPANGRLGIFLGKGDGTFQQSAQYDIGYESTSAAVADFDGDGHLRAVTNQGVSREGPVMVFFGKGDGTFQLPVSYTVGSRPYSIAAGDLNDDGRPDLAVAEVNAGVTVLLNNRKGKFGKAVLYPVSPTEVSDVVIADLNHDIILT